MRTRAELSARRTWAAAAVATTLLGSGCSGGAADPAPAAPTRAEGQPHAAATATPARLAHQDERVAAARAHAVVRFGYDPDELTVVSVEQVTWPSAAIGCPHHESSYSPTAVPGYRIVLGWNDVRLRYHGVDGDRAPKLCEFLD